MSFRKLRNYVTLTLLDRGFEVENIREDLIKAFQKDLKVNVWISYKDYLEWFDPLTIIEMFDLMNVDAFIVIAYRASFLADEILHSLDRARYWYDIFIDVKVYSVDISILEKAFEEVINNILTTFIEKVSNVYKIEGICPSCLNNLILLYTWEFNSKILEGKVIEKIYKCDSCRIKIHRLEKVS